jgi:FixJ family two-component response regulator
MHWPPVGRVPVNDPDRRAVAVVDDDPDVRSSLGFLLEVIGHPVQAFASVGKTRLSDPSSRVFTAR